MTEGSDVTNAPEHTCSACHTPLPGDAAFCPACGAASSPGFDGARSLPPRPSDPGGRYFDFIRHALREQYVIERELGRGGMAVVYLARDVKHPRKVAIKIMLPEVTALIGPDRFIREIEITAQLQHPNILPIHDSGRVGDVLYYVMPYVEGESLRDYLNRERQLMLKETLTIIGGVAHALSYAHSHGVIHRDIKPENILLTSGHPQVADFGVARAVSAAGGTITQTGAMVGTPAYMAPEQAAGYPDIDGRADLYALAAVACELLAGKRTDTLKDTQDSQNALMAARPDLPSGVARALTAPLAFDRDRRPASVDEWLEMIKGAEGRKRGKGLMGAIAAAAVVVVAVVIGLLTMSGGEATLATRTTIVVVPFSFTGDVDSMTLGATLPRAFEDLLRVLPEYRVVSSSRVRDAIVGKFGQAEPDLDTLISFVVAEFEASEVLQGRVGGMPGGLVRLDITVWADDAARVTSADMSGPVDSLNLLVSEVVLEAFGERIVQALAGYRQVLPRGGIEALSAWTEGETLFRRGAYDQAIERFQEVIAQDASFAYAYMKIMLAEVLRAQPTQATRRIRLALEDARRYHDSLDVTQRELLESYEILVTDGDLDSALVSLGEFVDRNPEALEGWFVLGFLRLNFAALLGIEPQAARREFMEANRIDPEFVATIAQLFRIAVMQKDDAAASAYAEQYLAIDSMSSTAELIQMVASAMTGGALDPVRAMLSFGDCSATVLETIVLSSGEFGAPGTDRVGALTAIDVLWSRAATARDRTNAFRMKMAFLLGAGQTETAGALLSEARSGPMRQSPLGQAELDKWTILSAVTGTGVASEEREMEAAAQQLVRNVDDGVSQWLAARWYSDRDQRTAGEAADRLRTLAVSDTATPLERSLVSDLEAWDILAAGDTIGALNEWAAATQRYNIEEVYFGLVGSLWPLRLEWARTAAVFRRDDEVLAATNSFEHMPGFIDQVAWTSVWPIRAQALANVQDIVEARRAYTILKDLLDDAEGSGITVRDSVDVWLGMLRGYRIERD